MTELVPSTVRSALPPLVSETIITDGNIIVVGEAHNGIDDDVILLGLQNSPCDINEQD